MVAKSNPRRDDRKIKTLPVQGILLELTRQLHATRVIHVLPAEPTANQKSQAQTVA
jgi:hypothetical protein